MVKEDLENCQSSSQRQTMFDNQLQCSLTLCDQKMAEEDLKLLHLMKKVSVQLSAIDA